MTLQSLFNDLQVYALFLIVGYFLRDRIPLLRKLFLPASVLGGIVALIGGPQVAKLWEVPKTFSGFANVLIALVCAASVMGVDINTKRLNSYMDFFLAEHFDRWAQTGLGLLVGILTVPFWPGLPKGWGLLGVFSFLGGHGNAAAYAAMLKDVSGLEGYQDLAMVLSTVGIFVAVVVGSFIANVGIRRDWGQFLHAGDALASFEEKGAVPKEKRKPIGMGTVYGGNVDALAFQFAILMVSIFLGRMIFTHVLGRISPMFIKVSGAIYGVVGAIIVWFAMKKLGMGDLVDKKSCNTLANFSMELMVLGAVARMNLKVVVTYWVPIAIMSLVMTAITAFTSLWFMRKTCVDQWFEKGMFHFGNYTGATSTGMLLQRMVDPTGQAVGLEAHGVCGGVNKTLLAWQAVVLPVMAVKQEWLLTGICFALTAVSFALGWVLFRKKVRALGR